jgi:hypothetical protein
VVAAGSRDPLKAAALLAEWGLSDSAAAYGSYEEVLADPNVQAVYIPLPSALHVAWVERAAARGLHVLLEKPIAVSGGDADAMVAACAAHGVQLMDGTMWVHSPRAAHMRAALRSGALGVLRDVASTFTFNAPPEFGSNVRMDPAADPLGCLGDMGWYCVRGKSAVHCMPALRAPPPCVRPVPPPTRWSCRSHPLGVRLRRSHLCDRPPRRHLLPRRGAHPHGRGAALRGRAARPL